MKMKSILKKHKYLILIALIVINFLGYYLIKTLPDFLDIIEPTESDDVIRCAKIEGFMCLMFFCILLIVNLCVVLFPLYLVIREFFKLIQFNPNLFDHEKDIINTEYAFKLYCKCSKFHTFYAQ